MAHTLTGMKDLVITAVNERPVPAVSLPAQEAVAPAWADGDDESDAL